MSTFDLLEKRHHVRFYNNKIPPKEKIESALWKAWKTTPSKNNAMPYKVFVYGPEQKEQKEKIWSSCANNHANSEKEAVKRGEMSITENGQINPYYEHIKLNPYLFAIHSQPRDPNDWYKFRVKKGMFFDQAYPKHVNRIVDSVAVEVGMFIQNLTSYLLEEKIDVSYTSCFERDIKKWHDRGITAAEYRPIVLMTAGYSETYRRDFIRLKYPKYAHLDIKPEYKDMIKWI